MINKNARIYMSMVEETAKKQGQISTCGSYTLSPSNKIEQLYPLTNKEKTDHYRSKRIIHKRALKGILNDSL